MTNQEAAEAMKTWAKVGAYVRRGRRTRQVVKHYASIDGGLRLDREGEGFVSWNVRDLKPFVSRKTK